MANPDTLAAAEDTPITYVAADLVGNDDDGDPELDQPLTIASVGKLRHRRHGGAQPKTAR